MNSEPRLCLRHHEGEDAYYLELRDHPHESLPGICKRTIHLDSLIENYEGPGLYLDFDEHGRAIGIEILYPARDEEDCPQRE